MGGGKTRVIIPMLALELCGKGDVVRLNFLLQLLPEAVEYLHACLTGAATLATVLYLQGSVKLYKVCLHAVWAGKPCGSRCRDQSCASEDTSSAAHAATLVETLPFADVLCRESPGSETGTIAVFS